MKTNGKIITAMELSPEDLLKAYDLYRDKFNPVDNESIENYEIVKKEILRRLNNEHNHS